MDPYYHAALGHRPGSNSVSSHRSKRGGEIFQRPSQTSTGIPKPQQLQRASQAFRTAPHSTQQMGQGQDPNWAPDTDYDKLSAVDTDRSKPTGGIRHVWSYQAGVGDSKCQQRQHQHQQSPRGSVKKACMDPIAVPVKFVPVNEGSPRRAFSRNRSSSGNDDLFCMKESVHRISFID